MRCVYALLTALLGCVPYVQAQLPANFQQQLLAQYLDRPLDMDFLPDGRMLVLLQAGEVLVSNLPQPQTPPVAFSSFMVLPHVISDQERGSTNIVLDPDFGTNGYFYLYYANSLTNKFQLSRFQDLGTPAARLASEFVIWDDTEPIGGCCHFGGAMAFLPDGTLLLTIGDKFQVSQSQDLTRTGGKILRLDPSGYLVYPTDNPYYDGTLGRYNASGQLQSIWAYGLRNPFSATMDTLTGRFYIAEVGGNVSANGFEDIHVGVQGANYGWPYCGDGKNLPSNGRDASGMCLDPAYEDPIFAYPHNNTPSCIMIGFVNHGTHFPTAVYDHVLFFSDHRRNFIRYLTLDNAGAVTGDFDFMPTGAVKVVGLWPGPDGSMYWLKYNTNTNGELYRIYWNGTLAPVVDSVAVQYPGPALTAALEGAFTDVDGDANTYEWFYGDGTSSGPLPLPAGGSPYTLPLQTHVYPGNGEYFAYLQIQGTDHVINSPQVKVVFGAPPVAVIDLPGYPGLFRAGMNLVFSGAASTDPDGTLTGADMRWIVEFNNAGTLHPRFGPTIGLADSFVVPVNNHLDFSGGKSYVITLTITDADGLTATATREVFPEIVNVTFASVPPGLPVLIDDQPRGTPFVLDNVVGFEHVIEMQSPVCQDGIRYEFDSWSIGGTPVRSFTMPETDSTVTATMLVTGDDDYLGFDGIDDYVQLPLLALAGPLTVECWVKPDSAALPATLLGDAATFALRLVNGRASLLALDGSPGTGYADPNEKIAAATALADSTWFHLALTRDAAGTLTLYLNGIQQASAATWTGTLQIDRLGRGAGGWLTGGLDEVRIWNTARSAADIQAYYDHTVAANTPGLLACYRMDDVGQVVADFGANGYDGSLGSDLTAAADDPLRNTTELPPLQQGPCEAVLLPAAVLQVAGEAASEGIWLHWALSQSAAGSRMEVQRWEDGRYEGLGQVVATHRSRYRWLDGTPRQGVNRYRVRLVGSDGHSQYAGPVEVWYGTAAAPVVVYPNPASTVLYLDVAEAQAWTCWLYDAAGRVVLRQTGTDAGQVRLSLAQVPAGIYYYRWVGTRAQQTGTLVVR
ncbi:MAG: hypothetical protein OHK0039_28000 [Bacteroidia bacterium]